MTKTCGETNWLVISLLSSAAALGGFLFGFDTAVISGAVGALKLHFHLDNSLTGWAVSSVLIGCLAGAAIGGPLSDLFGRKALLLACAIVFAISGLASAFAGTLAEFATARILGGLAIGAVSVISPLYIAEAAPENVRGRLVSLYQLAIVTGILIVFFINLLIQKQGDQVWNAAIGWRWMMGALTLPALLFGLVVLPIPESPRWLVKVGRVNEAKTILERIGGKSRATSELAAIAESLNEEQGRFCELLSGGYHTALIVGIGLAIFNQFGGINAIMYYAPEIFKSVGAGRNSAFEQTVVIGIVNLLFTFVAVGFVDRAGRRFFLIIGSLVQILALVFVGVFIRFEHAQTLLLVSILLFIAAFAMAMGPIPWIVISEIFPTKVRGKAMSVAIFILWFSDFLVSQTFPVLVGHFGIAATFFFYAGCSAVGLIFVFALVPETKGKSLEEIEHGWRKHKPAG